MTDTSATIPTSIDWVRNFAHPSVLASLEKAEISRQHAQLLVVLSAERQKRLCLNSYSSCNLYLPFSSCLKALKPRPCALMKCLSPLPQLIPRVSTASTTVIFIRNTLTITLLQASAPIQHVLKAFGRILLVAYRKRCPTSTVLSALSQFCLVLRSAVT